MKARSSLEILMVQNVYFALGPVPKLRERPFEMMIASILKDEASLLMIATSVSSEFVEPQAASSLRHWMLQNSLSSSMLEVRMTSCHS